MSGFVGPKLCPDPKKSRFFFFPSCLLLDPVTLWFTFSPLDGVQAGLWDTENAGTVGDMDLDIRDWPDLPANQDHQVFAPALN